MNLSLSTRFSRQVKIENVYLSTKPFADVTSLSYFQGEEEVLFMLGTIFRIKKVTYSNEESIWIAELSLCSNSDHDLRDLFAYQKEKIGQNSSDAVSLGDILFKMGEFDKAKQYYNRILSEVSTNNQSVANCYFGLGNVAIEQDDYSTALQHHMKALEVRQKFLEGNHRDLASSYNQIGTSYRRLCKYDKALQYCTIALTMRRKCLERNDVDMAQSYRDIGLVCYRLGRNESALSSFTKAHEIYTNVLPKNHPDIAENLGYIGYVYDAIDEYDSALEFYKKALDIDRKSLPEYHPDIGVIMKAIGAVLFKQHDYSSALDYLNQSLIIFRKSLPSTHTFIKDAESFLELVNRLVSPVNKN